MKSMFVKQFEVTITNIFEARVHFTMAFMGLV